MPFVLRDENTTENPPLATVYGRQITEGKLVYYYKDTTQRLRGIIILGDGGMEGIDPAKLYYTGGVVPQQDGTELNWKFHPGIITPHPNLESRVRLKLPDTDSSGNLFPVTVKQQWVAIPSSAVWTGGTPTTEQQKLDREKKYAVGDEIFLEASTKLPVKFTSGSTAPYQYYKYKILAIEDTPSGYTPGTGGTNATTGTVSASALGSSMTTSLNGTSGTANTGYDGTDGGDPTDPPPPVEIPIPTSLAATLVTGATKKVNLTWSYTDTGLDNSGYFVYRYEGSSSTGVFTKIAELSGLATKSYSDTSVVEGKSYTYAVAAYGDAGQVVSQVSNSAFMTVPIDLPAPTGLAQTGLTETSVTLSWSYSTAADGYKVYEIVGNHLQEIADTTLKTVTLTNLFPATAYAFKVVAYKNGYSSEYSSTLTLTTSGSGANGPTINTISTAAGTGNAGPSVTLTLSSPLTSSHTIEIYRQKAGESARTLVGTVLGSSQPSYTFTDQGTVVAGSVYYYSARTVDGATYSKFSARKEIVVPSTAYKYMCLEHNGAPITTWTVKDSDRKELNTCLAMYKATGGMFDTTQGMPIFFSEAGAAGGAIPATERLPFTFSGISYLEFRLPLAMSERQEEPTNFKIFVRGRKLRDYDAEGNEIGEYPIYNLDNPANNAQVAVDILLNYMKIPKERIDWGSYVAFRDYCNEKIAWDDGTANTLRQPQWNIGTSELLSGAVVTTKDINKDGDILDADEGRLAIGPITFPGPNYNATTSGQPPSSLTLYSEQTLDESVWTTTANTPPNCKFVGDYAGGSLTMGLTAKEYAEPTPGPLNSANKKIYYGFEFVIDTSALLPGQQPTTKMYLIYKGQRIKTVGTVSNFLGMDYGPQYAQQVQGLSCSVSTSGQVIYEYPVFTEITIDDASTTYNYNPNLGYPEVVQGNTGNTTTISQRDTEKVTIEPSMFGTSPTYAYETPAAVVDWGNNWKPLGGVTFIKDSKWENYRSVLGDFKMDPVKTVPVMISRFTADVVFPNPLGAYEALEQVFGRAPGCTWQDVADENGNLKIKFIVGPEYKDPLLLASDTANNPAKQVVNPGDRILAGRLAFDPEKGTSSNIVADSVSMFRKPYEQKQNFLRIEYRDLDDQYYTKKYIFKDRPEARDLAEELVDGGIVQVGVASKSLAERMGEATLRWNTDLDLELSLKATASTFQFAKGDLVQFAHPIPGWEDTDEAPIFIITEETFEPGTADERSFVLKQYSEEYYSDSDHGKIEAKTPVAESTALYKPEVASNVVLTVQSKEQAGGTTVSSISGTFNFSNFEAQYARIFTKYFSTNPDYVAEYIPNSDGYFTIPTLTSVPSGFASKVFNVVQRDTNTVYIPELSVDYALYVMSPGIDPVTGKLRFKLSYSPEPTGGGTRESVPIVTSVTGTQTLDLFPIQGWTNKNITISRPYNGIGKFEIPATEVGTHAVKVQTLNDTGESYDFILHTVESITVPSTAAPASIKTGTLALSHSKSVTPDRTVLTVIKGSFEFDYTGFVGIQQAIVELKKPFETTFTQVALVVDNDINGLASFEIPVYYNAAWGDAAAEYTVRVTSASSLGVTSDTPRTATVTPSFFYDAPAAPTALTHSITGNTLTLSWTHAQDSLLHKNYEIEAYVNGTWVQIATSVDKFYTETAIARKFRVRAVNIQDRKSSYSSEYQVVFAAPPQPAAPNYEISEDFVIWSWTNSEQSEIEKTRHSYYILEQETSPNTWTVIATTSELFFRQLAVNGTKVRLTSVNLQGVSSTPSATKTLSIPAPAAPTGYTLTYSSQQLVHKWTQVSGHTYKVYKGATLLGTSSTGQFIEQITPADFDSQTRSLSRGIKASRYDIDSSTTSATLQLPALSAPSAVSFTTSAGNELQVPVAITAPTAASFDRSYVLKTKIYIKNNSTGAVLATYTQDGCVESFLLSSGFLAGTAGTTIKAECSYIDITGAETSVTTSSNTYAFAAPPVATGLTVTQSNGITSDGVVYSRLLGSFTFSTTNYTGTQIAKIYIKPQASSTWTYIDTVVKTSGSTAGSFDIAAPELSSDSVIYDVQVVTSSALGLEAPSGHAATTITITRYKPTPPVPQNLTATLNSESQMLVWSWTVSPASASAYIDYYEVVTDTGAPVTGGDKVASTSFSETPATGVKRKVRAVSKQGVASAFCEAVTFTISPSNVTAPSVYTLAYDGTSLIHTWNRPQTRYTYKINAGATVKATGLTGDTWVEAGITAASFSGREITRQIKSIDYGVESQSSTAATYTLPTIAGPSSVSIAEVNGNTFEVAVSIAAPAGLDTRLVKKTKIDIVSAANSNTVLSSYTQNSYVESFTVGLGFLLGNATKSVKAKVSYIDILDTASTATLSADTYSLGSPSVVTELAIARGKDLTLETGASVAVLDGTFKFSSPASGDYGKVYKKEFKSSGTIVPYAFRARYVPGASARFELTSGSFTGNSASGWTVVPGNGTTPGGLNPDTKYFVTGYNSATTPPSFQIATSIGGTPLTFNTGTTIENIEFYTYQDWIPAGIEVQADATSSPVPVSTFSFSPLSIGTTIIKVASFNLANQSKPIANHPYAKLTLTGNRFGLRLSDSAYAPNRVVFLDSTETVTTSSDLLYTQSLGLLDLPKVKVGPEGLFLTENDTSSTQTPVSTSLISGSSYQNVVDSSAGVDWTSLNPSGTIKASASLGSNLVEGSSYVELQNGVYTNTLRVSGLAIASAGIPSDATIKGLEIQIDVNRFSTTAQAATASMKLVTPKGTGSPTVVPVSHLWPHQNTSTNFTTLTYGSSTDLWGLSTTVGGAESSLLTVADLTSSSWEILLKATLQEGVTVNVGNVRLKIHYTTPPSKNTLKVSLNENLTADRTLTLTTGNADRTLNLTGNLTVSNGSVTIANGGASRQITLNGNLTVDANGLPSGLGTMATQSASSVAITGGSITGITDLAIADGGTGASTAPAARLNLGAAASGANTDITSLYLNNTGLKLKDTDASHGLSIVPGSNLSTDRTLTISTGDASRTLTLAGDASISGTNTGDQTITLSGDVTGTGTAGITTTIAAGVVTNSKLQNSSLTVNGTAISLGGSATVTAVNPNALTIGAGLSGTSYNGSSAVTIALNSTLDSVARIGVRKNTAGTTLERRRINFIEGSNVTITIADDAGAEEVDVTIGSTAGGGTTTSALTLGTGITGGSFNGSTAVTAAIDTSVVATLSGTQTLSNKTITQRVSSTSSATALAPDAGGYDVYEFTALAADLTINATTGTVTNGQKLVIRAKDDTVARRTITLSTGAAKRYDGNSLGTSFTTAAGKWLTLGFIYNQTEDRWILVAVDGVQTSGSTTAATLTFGSGITGGSFNGGTAVTAAIDTSVVTTLTGTQTLTNKSLSDSTTFFTDETDASKKMQFELSGITTATTRTLTVPNVNGTLVTTGDTGSVTSTMIADGTIVNADISASAAIAVSKLASSSITVGTTAITLGSSSTTLAGLTSVSSTSFTGALTGNASTATTLATARTISIGTGATGTATSFDGSANITIPITALGASYLSGTIPTAVLGNSTAFVGTTAIALNRASANQALTGISSVAFPGATSGTITLQPAATAGTTTITMPATTGTLVTTGDTATVTNAMLAGSIAYSKLSIANSIVNADIASAAAIAYSKLSLSGSVVNADISATAAIAYSKLSLTNSVVNADISSTAAIAYSKLNLSGSIVNADISASAAIAVSKLASSSVTIGTTAITLGTTATSLAGLTAVTATTFTGALSGNATTATTLQTSRTINGVSFNGSANITVPGVQRVSSTTTLATLATDASQFDVYRLTAQSGNLTLSASTVTPNDGHKMVVTVKDNGTARSTITLTTGVSLGYDGGALGTSFTTVSGNWLSLGFIYNSASSRWVLVAVDGASSSASTLGISGGGTNNTTFTTGHVTFYDGTKIAGDGSLFWNNTNKRLGVGTSSPAVTLEALSTTEQLRLSYDASNSVSFTVSSAGLLTLTPKTGNLVITGANSGGWVLGEWTQASGTGAYAMIGHKSLSHTGYGNYAMYQTAQGRTVLNAASGQNLEFANNNTTQMTINGTGIGFYSATPVARPTTAGASATFASNQGGEMIFETDTFDGYTLAQVVRALKNLGLLT